MTAAVNKRPLTLDEAVGMAAGGMPCAIPVSGDCLEGAGIDNGDYVLVDFSRKPRPPIKTNSAWEHDFCLCYGTMPGFIRRGYRHGEALRRGVRVDADGFHRL